MCFYGNNVKCEVRDNESYKEVIEARCGKEPSVTVLSKRAGLGGLDKIHPWL